MFFRSVLLLAAAAWGARLVEEHEGARRRKTELHDRLATKRSAAKDGRHPLLDAATGGRSRAIVFEPSLLTVPVSSFEDLEAVISITSAPTTINVQQDISFAKAITIGEDKEIVIAGEGAPKSMSANFSAHFVVYGKVLVQNFLFTGGDVATNGGSILVDDGGSLRVVNCTFADNKAGDLPTSFPTMAPSLTPAPSGLPTPSIPTSAPTITVTELPSDDIPVADFPPRPYPGTGDGGAIAALNGSTLELENCAFRNNVAFRMGGAVVAEDFATLSVVDCLFEDNEALVEEVDGIPFGGGAIASVDNSVIDIVNSAFFRNRAQISGGAVYSLSNAKLAIEDSLFEANEVNPFIGELNLHYGGAVGAISTSEVSTKNNLFANHTWFQPIFTLQLGACVGISGADSYTSEGDLFYRNGFNNITGENLLQTTGFLLIEGGALYVDGPGTGVTVSGSSFKNNTAEFGGAIELWTSRSFASEAMVFANISDCEFVGNEAIGWGGGLSVFGQFAGADVVDSNFTANRGGFGGGASMYGGVMADLSFTNCEFKEGHAHQAGAASIVSAGALASFTDCYVHDNKADIIDDHFFQGSTSDAGGLEFVAGVLQTDETRRADPLVFSLVNTKVESNVANVDGGGIQANRWTEASVITRMNYTVSLDSNTRVEGNLAITGNGGGINVKSLLQEVDHVVLFDGAFVLNNQPDDIHSNETGLVKGTLSTFNQILTTGKPELFDLGPSS